MRNYDQALLRLLPGLHSFDVLCGRDRGMFRCTERVGVAVMIPVGRPYGIICEESSVIRRW